jgi:hypothetical protein
MVKTLLPFEVAIDSDNNNGFDLPDLSQAEDEIEEDLDKPGKIIVGAPGADTDGDGVPDFAEAHYGSGDGDNTVSQAPFTPIVFETGYPVSAGGGVKLHYSASDPRLVTKVVEDDIATYTAAPGAMRLWTKPAHEPRNPLPITEGGDYIPPDVTLDMLFILGERSIQTAYIEMVNGNGLTPIHIEWSGYHGGTYEEIYFRDTVLVTLIPFEIVRETQPGSGEFKAIKDGGLSNKAKLPVFKSESGTGLGDGGISGGYSLTAQISQNLTNAAVDTMTVKLTNSSGSFSGTLTETAAGSGIFKNAEDTFTLSLGLVVETTSGAVDQLDVLVTYSPLGLSNAAFTLNESSVNSRQFAAVVMHLVVEVSSSFSTASPDQITVTVMSNADAETIVDTLTETANDSKVFTRPEGDLTVTISSLSGVNSSQIDTMSATVDSSILYVPHISLSLTESGADSKEFSNYQRQSGNETPTTPTNDGQGVFYIQMAGTAAMDIKLKSAENEITVQAQPVPGETGKLRTRKVALIAEDDEFLSNDIDTLQVAAGEDLKMEIYGSSIPAPTVVNNAFVGRCFSLLTMPGGNNHLKVVKDRLITKLGWTVPVVNQAMTKSQALAAVPKHSLWYSFGHSISTKPRGSWTGFSAYAGAVRWGLANVAPSEVATANGTSHEYALVFINSCHSGDSSSVTTDMVAAFNAKSYVGWDNTQRVTVAAVAAADFLDALDGGATVDAAVAATRPTLGSWSTADFVVVTGGTEVIDLTP